MFFFSTKPMIGEFFQAQVQVRSQTRSSRSKDKDLDLGYTLNLVCHIPPPNFSWAIDHFKP